MRDWLADGSMGLKVEWKTVWREDYMRDPHGPEGFLTLQVDDIRNVGFGDKLSSAEIVVRGLRWRMFCAFHRVHRRNQKVMSFFLECIAPHLRKGWKCQVHGIMAIDRPNRPPYVKHINHAFNDGAIDWGYTYFMTLDVICDPSNGFVQNNAIKLKCYFRALPPSGERIHWNSREVTGFNGIVNQSATCYMNALLQSLFATYAFRFIIYNMPSGPEPEETNVVIAMKRLFVDLQIGDYAAETRALTRAFGWSEGEAARQQDVQEFNRVFLDNLESKMRGTSYETAIADLLRGRTESYVKCVDVEYESTTIDTVYDIQINLTGKDNLVDAFHFYTALELLEGENRYDAGPHGLQVAQKGVRFVELPPILHIQLMRFTMGEKNNAFFSFPDQLDLSSDSKLSETLTAQDCVYNLHSILVHLGDIHTGHYIAYVNTNLHETTDRNKSVWRCFDDETVYTVVPEDAVNRNFGGGTHPKNACAYMLVYVRQTAIPQILKPASEDEIPADVAEYVRAQQDGKFSQKKKKEGDKRRFDLTVLTEEIFKTNEGADLLEKRATDALPRLQVYHNMVNAELYKYIQDTLIQPENREPTEYFDMTDDDEIARFEAVKLINQSMFKFRLWKMVNNSETVFAPDVDEIPLTSRSRPSEFIPCEAETELSTTLPSDHEVIYLELMEDPDQYNPDTDIIFFIKSYNPASDSLKSCGQMYFKASEKFTNYHDKLCELADLPVTTDLNYYLEHASNNIEKFNGNRAIGISCCNQNGSILIIEKSEVATDVNNAASKLMEIYHTLELSFKKTIFNNFEIVPEEVFVAQYHMDTTLDVVRSDVAKMIGADEEKIIIWIRQNLDTDVLTGDYAEYTCASLTKTKLHDPRQFLQYSVLFAVMDFPISEVHVTRVHCTVFYKADDTVKSVTAFPRKAGSAGEFLNDCRRWFPFQEGGTGTLRLLQLSEPQIYNKRVCGIYHPETSMRNVKMWRNSGSIIMLARVEETPRDQLSVGPREFLVPMVYLDYENVEKVYGMSELILLKAGEPNYVFRNRLRAHLKHVREQDFKNYRFSLVTSADYMTIRPFRFEEGGFVNLRDVIDESGDLTAIIGIKVKNIPQVEEHEPEIPIRIYN